VCVTSNYPACNAHAPHYIAIFVLSGSTKCFHIIPQTARFSGKNLERGGSSIVGRGLAGYVPDNDQQRSYHHTAMLKPEAANAVASS
jgi:hypothetical protein